jgi:hypothetical protein
MAFEAQIDKLVEKLTELTRADKVIWQETAEENTFLTAVGQSVVTVGRVSSAPSAPCFMRILDATGKTIEEAYAAKSDILTEYRARRSEAALDVAVRDLDRLQNLLELARRSAMKSDKFVSDLLSTLEAIR